MKCITIIGNLGANAVCRIASDGASLMSFHVAVNVPNADPVWFNCIGRNREKLFPYLVKGQNVCVVGELLTGAYNGKMDLSVSIDKVELCGPAPAKEEEGIK